MRGTRNAASWAVAGGLAYYLIWVPEQRRRDLIEARARARSWHASCALPLAIRRCAHGPTHPHLAPTAAAQRERLLAKERAVAKGLQDIDRARPLPDPQDRGIIKGGGGGSSGSG